MSSKSTLGFVGQFEGAAGEEFQEQAAQLCSQQSQALELIKNKQRKDQRFAHIIQVHTHTLFMSLLDLFVCLFVCIWH